MLKQLRKLWSINSSRVYLSIFAQSAANSLPYGAKVLDAGAGDCPYRSNFAHTDYFSTDLCNLAKDYGQLSYISDLKYMPIRAESYDLIFCSQTLEHVNESQKVLSEFERVLKPNGHVWLTVPFFYAEHEAPFDYFRFTQFGLIYLFQKAGFKVESIEWLEGYFGTLAYQLVAAAKALPIKPRYFGSGIITLPVAGMVGLLKIFFAFLSLLFTWLDIRTKYVSKGYCKNYAVIAVKPGLSNNN